ncbi:MAG: hypothetical protein ACM3O6_06515 [Acidobacteriota bacterium]
MFPSPQPPEQPLYFVNAWLDAAVIGGLSLGAFIVLRWLPNVDSAATAQAVSILSIVINYPHFSATVYRLYQTPENLRQFPVTAFGLPILLLGAVIAALWQPEVVAPYLIILFMLWSPYHYSGQTIGITMIYARRCGFQFGRWERMALSTFVFSTFVVTFAHVIPTPPTGPTPRYGFILPAIPFPDWFETAVVVVMYTAAAAFLWLVVDWCRRSRRLIPPVVLLPAAAQFIWFVPGAHTATFYAFVPTFHCLQYLYVAWAMQMGLRLGRDDREKSWRSIGKETLRWSLRNCVGGAALFIALPWLFSWIALPAAAVTGIVLAGVNIHHFFVDGVIWKLRNVGAQSPLMMRITDLAVAPLPVRA